MIVPSDYENEVSRGDSRLPQVIPAGGAPLEPSIYSAVLAAVDQWGEYLRESEGRPETTVQTYMFQIRGFAEWLQKNPQNVTRKTFERYRNELKTRYSPSTVNLSVVTIRRFLEWLEMEGMIPTNPALGVKGVKRPKGARVHKRDELTGSEIGRVLALVDAASPEGKRDRAMLRLMAYNGLRQIELTRLRFGDYQTRGNYRVLFLQGKGRAESDEYTVVTPETEQVIGEWIAVHPFAGEPERPIFCSLSRRSHGEPLSTSYIRRIVGDLYKRAGIREKSKTTHSLRHSAITAVLRNGGSVREAQIFARHSSYDTTLIYAHEIDRLENPPELRVSY